MVAPIRYLSRREQQQKIGILSSTEDEKVLEVVGRVGIGTTIFDAEVQLDVRGTTNISGSLGIGTTNPTSEVHVSGVGTTANVNKIKLEDKVPSGQPRVRIGSHHWDEIYTSIHTKDVASEIWIEQNSDNKDGADLVLYKSRGVPGAETPAMMGDNLGRINVRGFSTTATASGAGITLRDYPNIGGSLEWNVDFLGTNAKGIGYPAASFNVKGQDAIRFTVASGGNVGIGSTTPTAKLDVNGTVNVTGVSTFNNKVGIASLDPQSLLDVNGTLNVSGISTFNNLVGIATINPKAKLDVNGTLNVSGISTFNNKVGIATINPTASLDVAGSFNVTGVSTFRNNIDIVSAGNTSTITGPSNLILDPAGIGDNTGKVIVLGDLQVDGTQTIIHSTTLEVDDKLISIAKSATNATQANGAGLDINGANATLTYAYSDDRMVFNKDLQAPKFYGDGSNLTNITAGQVGAITGSQIITTATNDTHYYLSAVDVVSGITSNVYVRPNIVMTGIGSVGIGTTQPTHTFDVAGNIQLAGKIYDSSNSEGTSDQVLTSNGSGSNWSWKNINSIGAVSGSLIGDASGSTTYYISATNATTGISSNSYVKSNIVLKNNKIGIGTDSPTAHLEVYSTSANTVDREIRIDASDAPKNTLQSLGLFRIIGDGNAQGKYIVGYNTTHPVHPNLLSFNNLDGGITFKTPDGGGSLDERVRITSDGNVGIGSTQPTAKLDVDGTVNVTGIATFSDNVSIANTENKTYPPTGSSWNVSVGLDQYLEVGGTQVVNSNGVKRVSGIRNRLIKNNGNTQEIRLLHHNGIDQSFIWSDLNTCNDYEGVKDEFVYFGHDANGETSYSFEAGYINLIPSDGETQTITNTKSDERTLQLRSAATSGISTINITNAKGYSHRLVLFGGNSGTHNYNITNFTAFETSPNWMSAVIFGTINATITNYYGLKLNPPSATTGLTITNNYGVYSGWSSSTNYFAGVVGIGTTAATAPLTVRSSAANVDSGISLESTAGLQIVEIGQTGINGGGHLELKRSGSSSDAQLNVGANNETASNRGVMLWAGNTSNDFGRISIISNTETDYHNVFRVVSAPNSGSSKGTKLIFTSDGGAEFARSGDKTTINQKGLTSGIITATSFFGDGSNLTGISAGIGTTGSVNTSGIITATEFVGGGSDLRNLSGTHLVSYASASDISNSALSISGISTYNEVGILTGTYANNAVDLFSESVATSADGKTIVVGAYRDEYPGSGAGSGVVYVYDRQGNYFNEVGILTGSNANNSDDYFGWSVATSADGKTIVVGARDDETSGSDTGVVYVFDRVGNNFNEVGILTGSNASDSDDQFGDRVATSADGKTIIVGARSDETSGSDTGVVYVFDRVGNNFNQVGILTGTYASDSGDSFGCSLANSADGKTIIVGARLDEYPGSGTSSGVVYVYDRQGNNFNQVGILTGSNVGSSDHFGHSVATSADGKSIVVGAVFDETVNTSSGVVYVFDRVGNNFNQVGILTGTYAANSSDYFGGSLATSADGKTIIIGAISDETSGTTSYGLVYVFNRQGNNFNEVSVLSGTHASEANDNFGYSVATSADGKSIVVGAPQDETSGTDGYGVVYVYDQERETYVFSDANGNIGIGSSQPTAKLDIVGGVNASGIITATESNIAFFTTKNYSRSWPYTNWSSSQQGVTLQTTGRNLIIQAGGAQTTRSYVSLTNGGGVWIGGGTGDPEGVNIEAGSGDVKITGGNVGIGSTQPTVKLDVVGGVKASGIITASSFSGDGSNLTGVGGGVAPTENTTNQSQFIPFFTGTGSTTIAGISTQKFVFNPSTTRLGIGLTDPSSTLEINVGTATSALDIQGSAGQLFSVTNNLTSGSIFSVNDVSGIPSIDVDADGTIQLAPFGTTEFVGVGKTNPQAKLDVNGDAVVNGSIGIGTTNPQFDLDIGGSVNATSPKTAGVGTVRIASTLGIGVTDFTRTGAFPVSSNRGGVLTLGGDYSTGDNPVIIFDSHPSSTSFVNLLIGDGETGRMMTNQHGNVYIGGHAGRLHTGTGNIAIGSQALTDGSGATQIAIGYRAGCDSSGQNNVCIGKNSGASYDTAAANNVFLGHNAGSAGGGNYDNNILIGSAAGNADFRPAKGADDQLAIGFRSSSIQPEKYWIVGDENQNIGIGTTNPTSKLHIRDDSANANHAVLRLENLQTAGSRTECNIQMWLNNSNANNPGASIGAIENGNDGYADIVFQTTPQSNSSTLEEKARITAGGNVGIGSTIPRAPLDVPGGGAVRLLLSENTTLTGSSVDVTGIPAWATRITILFYRMSAGSTNNFGVRMGTSGGVISSGYDSNSVSASASSNGQASNKFVILNTSASHQLSGRMVIEKLSDSVYTSTHYLSVGGNTSTRSGAGLLESISGTIDRVQMIMTTGTFDNGSFTVYVE